MLHSCSSGFVTAIPPRGFAGVATGCAMVGLHASALIMPALSLVFLLTQNTLRWQKVLWFLLGLALIASGPIGYYGKFATVIERVEEKGWQETGTGWVGRVFQRQSHRAATCVVYHDFVFDRL